MAEGPRLAAVVVIVSLILLRLADNCADTCACSSADDRPFQAAAEQGSKDSSAASADQRAFTGSDTTLIMVVSVAVIATISVAVVIVAAMAAITDAVVEVVVEVVVVPIATLRSRGKYAGRCQ